MIRKWDIADEQKKKQCVTEVIARVDEQQGSQFGVIAAQEVVDIVAAHLGPQIYNTAIEDVKKAIRTKLADLEVDLDILRVVS